MSQLPNDVERIQQMEVNRLKAKARFLAQQNQNRTTSNVPNQHNKRPLQVTPADSTSPTAPHVRHLASTTSTLSNQTSASSALQNAMAGPSRIPYSNNTVASRSKQPPATSGLGITSPAKDTRGREIRTSEFVDYDLSTLKNSKGGFLLIEEEADPRIARQRRIEEERKAQRLREAEKRGLLQDPALHPDPEQNAKCQECGTVELDFQIHKVFGVPVCPKCKVAHPEKYSLLTKTECKEDYLLTDPELKDEELLPHLLKPNPHRSTYSNMMLYLRCQVEAFAFSSAKWGSPEALDAEFERRQAEKKKKKNKKFADQLKELRKRTKNNLYQKRQEEAHVHEYETVRNDDGSEQDVCKTCGFAIDVETF